MGLTTLMIGAGATRSGTPHLALELALARLGARTQRYAARYGPIRRSESYVDRPSAGDQGG